MILSSQKFVKKSKKEKKEEEAFDGNIWISDIWSRTAMVACSLIHVIFIMVIVQFSFSSTFGDNIFLFIGVMKMIGMATAEITESVFDDKLLICPTLMIHELMESIVTFGASDFLDFLVSYYVELGKKLLRILFIF